MLHDIFTKNWSLLQEKPDTETKMGDKKTEEICNIQDTENGKYSKDKKKE